MWKKCCSGYPVVYERAQKTARGDLRDYVLNYFPRYGDGADEGKVVGLLHPGQRHHRTQAH
jgi:hypothetical protein